MIINNQKGVTLTEAVVTFTILGILAAGLLTILGVNATETSEGITNSRMQMQYDNIMDQISRDAKYAMYILDQGSGEAVANITTYITNKDSVTSIRMYDSSGIPFAGYSITGAALEELIDSANGTDVPFRVGKDAVSLAPGSKFYLAAGRKAVRPSLNLKFTYKTVTDTLRAKPYFVRCRN